MTATGYVQGLLPTTGGTMTGTLVLSAAAPLQVTTTTPGAGKVLTSDASGNASWSAITASELPAATTTTQGAVILDGTAGDIAALGAQAAGAVGKAADAGHVHPTTGLILSGATAGGDLAGTYPSPSVAKVNGTSVPAAPAAGQILIATSATTAAWAYQVPVASALPTGALAETVPRVLVTTSTTAITGGTLYLAAVTLRAGVTYSNVSFVTGLTAGAGITHAWFVLTDSTRLQLAHTADQTSGSIASSSVITKALTAPYTPVADMTGYIGLVVTAATTLPTLATTSGSVSTAMTTALPVAGSSSAGLTTPGTDGVTTYGGLTGTVVPYGYLS